MPDPTEREAAIRLAASRLRDSLGVPIADARFLLDQLDAARRERDEARRALQEIATHRVRRTYAGDAVQDALSMQRIAGTAFATYPPQEPSP